MALECLTSSEVDESAAEEARFLQKYLELTATAKGVGDVIKTLAVERAASRAHCEVLLWKIPNGPKRRELRKELDRRQISSIVEEYDKEVMLTDFEEALETAVKAGGIVGAFGAGIAYTTIFTAARGRLDLISGAFTCFLVVVIVCTGMRAIALPTLYAGHLRNGPRSMKKTVMVHLVLYAAPLLAGFILLGVSVGTIDGLSRTPVLPGSRAAMQVSGYLPVAILGYFVVSLILVSMSADTGLGYNPFESAV
ncbi:hypothetical protein JB92DRAFT_3126535 [Gautieria morchelliformis]|nr:hypothetical protein JB92DRAFT_3126535 [Gautieria morchelliformis]